MSKSVNLVSDKSDYLEREQRILAILRGIAVSLLITIAIISVATFIIGATIPLSSIKQDENSTINSIAALHKKLATFNYTKDRIKGIQNLLSTRKDLTKPFNTIYPIFPQNTSVNSFSIEKGAVQLTLSSDSLLDLNKFINDLYDLGSKNKVINDVVIDSLSLNSKTGVYSLSMEAKEL